MSMPARAMIGGNLPGWTAEDYAGHHGSCEAGLKAARLDRGLFPRRSKSRRALDLDREIARLEMMARGERDAAYADRELRTKRGDKRAKLAGKLLAGVGEDDTRDDDVRDLAKLIAPVLAGGSADWPKVLAAVQRHYGGAVGELLELAVALADDEAKAAANKGDWGNMNLWNADAHTLAGVRKVLHYR